MKVKKNLLTFTVAGLMALLLCVPATVIAGGGPNPGVPAGYKASGPQLKGVLIVGWRFYYEPPESGIEYGIVEAFLHVEGNFYTGVMDVDNPEWEFRATTAADIPGYDLPPELAAAYNMAEGTIPAVLGEKHISNFEVFENIGAAAEEDITYRHMLHCDVKITFLVPVKKQ